MENYIKRIDKKKTRQRMMETLTFLQTHVDAFSFNDYNLAKNSNDVLVNVNNVLVRIIHDNTANDLLDFLPSYTCSIVKPGGGIVAKNAKDLAMLDAIARKDLSEKEKQHRDEYIKWVLSGVSRLDVRKQMILLDKYMLKIDDEEIEIKENLSNSTLYRTLNEAFVELAVILKVEIFRK